MSVPTPHVAPPAANPSPKPPSPRFAAFMPDALEILATPTPVRYHLTLYLLLGFVGVALAFSCLAKVDRIVSAPGKLVSAKRNITIQPLETSVVREVLVTAGQAVAKGQPLVSLDPTFAEAGLEEQDKERAGLAAKVWRLTCETSGDRPPPAGLSARDVALERDILLARGKEYAAKAEALGQKVRELAAKLETNAAEAAKVKKQIKLSREVEQMYGDIYAKGASSKLEYMKAESGRIESEGQLEKLRNESRELRESLARAEAEKRDFENNWRAEAAKELAEASRSLAGAEERLRKSSRLRELVVLRSPEDGTVLDAPARAAGAVAPQGETLLTIVPRDDEMVVEAEVAAQDIGRVRVGDPARIKFEAFPFQRHGTAQGVVQSVSPDALEKNTPEGQRLFYRVRAAVAEARLTDVPPDFRLFPGMALTAEIKIGSRRIITYLLYPLIRSFDESLREP